MKVIEKKKEQGTVILEAVAGADDVEKAFEAAYVSFAQQMGLKPDGDKTISQIAEEQLGLKDLDATVAPQVVDYLTPFAVDKKNLMPAYPARVTHQATARRGSELPFTLEVALKSDLELSSYDPVVVKIPPFEVSEADIEKQLAQMAESYADFVQIEPRPARIGDSCLLNILAQENGVDVPELTMENAIYELGSNTISKEFDQHIVGMNASESKTFPYEYPAQDIGDAPRTIELTVELLETREKVIPAIDDEWIKQNAPAAKNAAGFKRLIKAELEKELFKEYENMKRQEVTAELAKRYTGDISDEAILAMQKTIINNMRMQLQEEGVSLEDYIKNNGGDQQFNVMTMMQSKENLAQGYALDALFRHEGLSLSDEDIREACKTFDPENPDMIRKQMEYSGCGYMLRETAERLKASNWLLEHAEIIEEKS